MRNARADALLNVRINHRPRSTKPTTYESGGPNVIDVTKYAEPDPATYWTGEEGQTHADCLNCGGEIFCDQDFNPATEQAEPPADKAYWQHNDERYRPNALSWCRPWTNSVPSPEKERTK